MSINSNAIYPLLLFIIGFLLYFNTVSHNYVLDDFSVIKENIHVKKGVSGLPDIWKTHYRHGYGFVQANLYRPLTLSIFAFQWELAPDSPMFGHLINILLYAFLGQIVFYFLIKLFGNKYRLFCFASTILFISHPIHTEVVANIKSLDDILVMGFSLVGIIYLIKYIDQSKKKWLLISLILFMLAFLSKESAVTFMLLIPVIIYLFKEKRFKKAISYSSWYLIPFGIYLLMRYRVLGSISGDKTIAVMDNLLMATSSIDVRIATALKILAIYLWKLVFPHPLMNDYSINQITLTDFSQLMPYLAILVYGVLVLIAIKYHKKFPILSFGIAFYLISISLYSNLIFTIGTSFGERLLFAPSLGFCLILTFLIFKLFKTKLSSNKFKKAATPIYFILALVTIYSFKTVDRNKAWSDNFTLYATDIENCNKSARCHYYYGLGLMKEKALNTRDLSKRNQLIKQAVESFKSAIRIYPNYSDAWGQLGLAFYRLENYRAAENAYLKAAEYNPSNATALSNLGSLYFDLEKYDAAKKSLQKAVRVNPNHLDAIYNYASTLGTLGEFDEAIIYFKKAIELDPKNPNYYQMTAITYQNMGNPQQANNYYQRAKQLRE